MSSCVKPDRPIPTWRIGEEPSQTCESRERTMFRISAVISVGLDVRHCFWATEKSLCFMNIDTQEAWKPERRRR